MTFALLKKSLSLFVLFAVNGSATGQSFIDQLVSDNRDHSYYLVVQIDSPNYKGEAIIENMTLSYFLYRTRGMREAKYESFARDLLMNKSPLKINKRNIEHWGFKKVIRSDAVDSVAAKGKEEFLNHYFGGRAGRFIKEQISRAEEPAIIEKLFEWQIAASHDDYTGFLYFTEFK